MRPSSRIRPAPPLHASLADSVLRPFWLDGSNRPTSRPTLSETEDAELVIVGGGFTGLWTAVLAKERDLDREVVLLDRATLGWAASGRNGGFCSASLTHGRANGERRFPQEIEQLERLGLQNLREIKETIERYQIDCDFQPTGTIAVATQPYQAEMLREGPGEYLDQAAIRAQVNSPTYLAGRWDQAHSALIDPAALVRGLADTAEALGVRIFENTHVMGARRDGSRLRMTTGSGATVRAESVALATNAFTPLVRRLRHHTVPVYDYVLVSEPLTATQLESVGWRNRQGMSDTANQFHYYRLTADNRILWGGYDAIYHFGGKVRPAYDDRPATFSKLAAHFFTTFPQLEGLRFTHRWGGAIDTCTRFSVFFGKAFGDRAAYALGYTGLGVGASRFGANVMLDLLSNADTERTRLDFVRSKPLPFPPEPAAFVGIQATRAALAAADDDEGRRNLWLRTLDRFGLGFDS